MSGLRISLGRAELLSREHCHASGYGRLWSRQWARRSPWLGGVTCIVCLVHLWEQRVWCVWVMPCGREAVSMEQRSARQAEGRRERGPRKAKTTHVKRSTEVRETQPGAGWQQVRSVSERADSGDRKDLLLPLGAEMDASQSAPLATRRVRAPSSPASQSTICFPCGEMG